MGTIAISFVSESGDHYLEVLNSSFYNTNDKIVTKLKTIFREEFGYLYVLNTKGIPKLHKNKHEWLIRKINKAIQEQMK
jgi:hypothetical protein